MRASRTARVVSVVVGSLVFGALLSVIKGNGSGLRDAIGNVSAPWLLLAFVAGAAVGGRHLLRGAAVGMLATLVALAAFYVTNTFVLDLGPHSWLQDLRLTAQAGRRYFALALVSGPVFGAAGAWWGRGGSKVLGIAIAAMFLMEPVAWAGLEPGSANDYTNHPVVWISEIAVGVAGVVAVVRTGRVAEH